MNRTIENPGLIERYSLVTALDAQPLDCNGPTVHRRLIARAEEANNPNISRPSDASFVIKREFARNSLRLKKGSQIILEKDFGLKDPDYPEAKIGRIMIESTGVDFCFSYIPDLHDGRMVAAIGLLRLRDARADELRRSVDLNNYIDDFLNARYSRAK